MAESYGGRDEPLDTLVSGFVAAGVDPLLDLRVKGEPCEAVYQVRERCAAGLGWGGEMLVPGAACLCFSCVIALPSLTPPPPNCTRPHLKLPPTTPLHAAV